MRICLNRLYYLYTLQVRHGYAILTHKLNISTGNGGLVSVSVILMVKKDQTGLDIT